LAKSSALSLSVADCDGGCSKLLTVFHSARGLRRHASIADNQQDENLAWNSFLCALNCVRQALRVPAEHRHFRQAEQLVHYGQKLLLIVILKGRLV